MESSALSYASVSASVPVSQPWGYLANHIVDDLFDENMNPIKEIKESSIELEAFYNGHYWMIIHPCAHDILESLHANYANKGYIAKCITAHKMVPIPASLTNCLGYWYYN